MQEGMSGYLITSSTRSARSLLVARKDLESILDPLWQQRTFLPASVSANYRPATPRGITDSSQTPLSNIYRISPE